MDKHTIFTARLSGLSLSRLCANLRIDVNKNNYLSQLSINSSAYTWAEGPLNKLKLKVLDTDPVGMKACMNLGPIAGVPAGQTVGHGSRLFVATGETTFEQYSWYPDMADWTYEQTWHNLNGHASPACFGWGKGHTFYVWFVNSGNDINMYWWVGPTAR